MLIKVSSSNGDIYECIGKLPHRDITFLLETLNRSPDDSLFGYLKPVEFVLSISQFHHFSLISVELLSFDRELKNTDILAHVVDRISRLGIKVQKFSARTSSLFNSLSNETIPTAIRRNLWDQLYFW